MIALVSFLSAVRSYFSPDGVFDVDHLFVEYDILQKKCFDGLPLEFKSYELVRTRKMISDSVHFFCKRTLFMYVYVYMYIYIYVYIYTYMYIYTECLFDMSLHIHVYVYIVIYI